jgi:hypothetical protein
MSVPRLDGIRREDTIESARCTVGIDRQGIRGAGALGILPDPLRAIAKRSQ